MTFLPHPEFSSADAARAKSAEYPKTPNPEPSPPTLTCVASELTPTYHKMSYNLNP